MTTPKVGKKTQEIIGMTLPGIEDYTGDYDSDDSDSSTVHTLNVINQGMIRQSFQVLLPRPSSQNLAGTLMATLPLPLTDRGEMSTDDDDDDDDDDSYLYLNDEIEEEEADELIDKMITVIEQPVATFRIGANDLELDENSSDTSSDTTDGSCSGTDDDDDDTDSDDDDDNDSTSDKEDSSSWGSETDNDLDEGGITYLATLTQNKTDKNIMKFVLTPFDSVIEESTKSLKMKYDKITYPMGSKFFSEDLLKSEDYHRLQNIQLVKWIKGEEDDKQIEEATHNIKSVSLRINPEEDLFAWLKKSINKVYAYYRGNSVSDLTNCFHLMDRSVFEHFSGDGYMMMLRTEQLTENYELYYLFEILLHTFARLSCKLSSNHTIKRRFYYHLEHTKKIFPKYKVHLELLKEMHKAHMDKHNAIHCIRFFVQTYHKYQHIDREDDIASFELSVKALVALDLYMENYSPLNQSILSDKAAYDINSERFKWLDDYNKYKNKYQHHGQPDDDDDDDEEEEKTDDWHLLQLELCSDPQSRINRLMAKYRQFRGFSLLRARVSWVIGHSKLYHQRNFYHSEKHLFEALYCLKKLSKYEFFPLNQTMYTELASLVLIDWADVLLENKKYPYAIIALEKVIDCLKKRKLYERQFQIIRKLCITCTEKEDWTRAIKYHNITLKQLKDSYLNLNEFVYLSQQISTIHLKLHNFNQSEKELQNGIKTIYLNVLSYHNNGSLLNNNGHGSLLNNLDIKDIFELCEGEERLSIGSLILVLANLYISGGHYLSQAIQLLQYLRKHIFTNKSSTRRILVLFQLSRAYFKNGRYEIADNIVEQEILSRYSFKNNKLLSSFEFIQLRILIMIHCQRFNDALKVLDDTMEHMIQKESFVKRAKINYLKGRVLQCRCFDKLMRNYEKEKERMRLHKKRESARMSANIVITKAERRKEEKEEMNTLFSASATIHESTPLRPSGSASKGSKHRRGGPGGVGDLIFTRTSSNKKEVNPLDAQSALLVSHSDFRTVQDPIMQAKCCLELGKTYLEIIMEYYALPKYVLKDMKCSDPIIKWLGLKIFNDDYTPNDEVITHCLDEINRPLYAALELTISQTKDITLLIESYIALAEFEFLKEEETSTQTSKNFWKQSKYTLFSTYKDSNDWIFLRRIDRHSRLQIFSLFKRILRLLICYDNGFIADNVEIFESYIALETFMVAQKDIKHDQASQSRIIKEKNDNQESKNKSSDFARNNSNAIYMRSSSNVDAVKDGNNNNHNHDTEEKEMVKNPTVTFRISDEQNEGLSRIRLSSDTKKRRPLYPRYRNLQKKSAKENINNELIDKMVDIGGERYLDELFRMHWKMRTDANMFSGGRMLQIDNDEALVRIIKCISALTVQLDIGCTLNGKHRCWSCNETFIISLDSIVFLFHPHTLFKYGISKKRTEMASYHEFKSFASILSNIAFHDGDFLKLEDNPWIKNDYKQARNRFEMSNKKRHNLSREKEALLQNELTLPYLKLESIKELLMCLDPQNILNVLGAIFSECQIIIVSKERCRALAIIDALFVLMYPFSWQYPCIAWLSPYCFELLNLPIPYIFGVANFAKSLQSTNDLCSSAVIVDADTNNLMKPKHSFEQLPLKIKSKLTRAMFRLMSGLLKNAFQIHTQNHWVFPPRRRDNMKANNKSNIIDEKYNLLSSPCTAPISICSERKRWYNHNTHNQDILKEMVIHFQKEFSTAWVEVLEQYRLFWVNINSALHRDLKSKSTGRIQKYAHPRYRKFLTEIQKTRMFSSFQCIRSLANTDMLTPPLFDNLVMRSLKWRQSLYHEIIQQQQREESRMRVSVENSNQRHFTNHLCTVVFDPKECKLYIRPDLNIFTKQRQTNLAPFEVILKATDYELESDGGNKMHPYCDAKQVEAYGEQYQFKIKHEKDGTLTLNCENYYELTRWIHMIRTHSMDTWSWFLKF